MTRKKNEAIGKLLERLSPEVAEIVRLDLIQKVGNALRYKRNIEQEGEALDEFAEQVVLQENSPAWATW